MDSCAAVLGLCLCLAAIFAPTQAQDDTQTISASPGTNSSTAQCIAQGLSGQCNSCVCCCYNGSSAFINYAPTAECTCSRSFNSSEIKLAVVLAVIVVVPTLLTSCYLGGQLPITPFKRRQRRGSRGGATHSPERQRSPQRQHQGGTLELTARAS